MQSRARGYFRELGNKTLGYIFEQSIAILCSIAVFFYTCYKPDYFSFLVNKDFLDKLITVGTTLFGFLIAVVTLIIQSNSELIKKMREHDSYKRLVNFNKRIVTISAIMCLVSLTLTAIEIEGLVKNMFWALISKVNFSLFIWTIIDTAVFVRIFYILQIADFNSTNNNNE